MSFRPVIILLCSLLLLSCTSPQPAPDYYLLSARHNHGADVSGPSLGLRPVSVPEYLRRSALVRTSSRGDITISARERWAEPLEDGIRRVMGLNLATLLPTQDLRHYPWSAARQPDWVVTINVLELVTSETEARLVVEAVLSQPGRENHSGLYRLSQAMTGGDDGAAVTNTLSDLLAELAEQLADALRDRAQRDGHS